MRPTYLFVSSKESSDMDLVKRRVPHSVFDSKEARRIQAQGHREACAELDRKSRQLLGEGNPNHPMYDNELFGYGEREFMAKQYR